MVLLSLVIGHWSLVIGHWLIGALGIFSVGLLTGCDQPQVPTGPVELESRFNDEQPALSGNGRFLAFVSNRDGTRSILLYDLRDKRYVILPRLNRRDAIAESPSLSYTGRYIAYVASDSARPEIELYDRATQQTQILTIGYRGWFRNPKISPDGRYIAFETGSRGQWDIEVLDRGSGIELDMPDYQRNRPNPGASPP
ncbi:MAG: biopolymer transporter Tol [Leptolyngbyaceae cyanobacterium bins.302]|nr:biopolymer transporter Tol [Leptolyngbyaceae cyanobacterium bins.302]